MYTHTSLNLASTFPLHLYRHERRWAWSQKIRWMLHIPNLLSMADIIYTRMIHDPKHYKTGPDHKSFDHLMTWWHILSVKIVIVAMNWLRKCSHGDVIKWKHYPHYWPFMRGIHWSHVNSPHKDQWRGVLTFSLICSFNKRLSKQWCGWWLETPLRPLWSCCNVVVTNTKLLCLKTHAFDVIMYRHVKSTVKSLI